jgi:hypothetical protein
MEQRIIDILQAVFPGMKVQLEIVPGERIWGRVIWAGYADLDDIERQREIRSVLREKLGEDARQVGLLLTYTPDEMRTMEAA